MNKLLVIFILILILIFNQKKEKMMRLKCMKKKCNKKKFKEINELDSEYIAIHSNYTSNNNHILNDGFKIFQEILDPSQNNIVLSGHRYNLSNIEFHLGTTTFKYKKVGLELHLVHSNAVGLGSARIIIPLSLEHLRRNNFQNNKMENNHLGFFENINDIPQYQCCTITYGKLLNFDFSELNKILNNCKRLKRYKVNEDEIWFYSLPQKYNRFFGLEIINNLLK